MNIDQYHNWCKENGYITANDWNYQIIDTDHYYFIINPKTDKFALIKFSPEIPGTFCQGWYEVLIKGWTDYNGWANKFHEETGGSWK